jgi:hypothetical protein
MTTDEVYRRARVIARGRPSVVLRRQERRLVALANVRRLLESELAQLVAVRAELRLRAGPAGCRWGWTPLSRRRAASVVRKP